MVGLLLLIDRYAPLIYLLLFLGILVSLLVFFSAQREVARARKYVAREEASARAYRSGFLALGLLLALAAAAFVDTRLAPTLATLNQDEPSITTPPSETPPLFIPTPTLPRTIVEVGTPAPTAVTEPPGVTQPPPAFCAHPQAHITSPGDSATLQGIVEVKGTADITNFWYYKLEVASGDSPIAWRWIGAEYQPVTAGVLILWDTSIFPPGPYSLRLVVVDKTGNFPEPCQVVVNISG